MTTIDRKALGTYAAIVSPKANFQSGTIDGTRLEVNVDDGLIRSRVDGFDGRERVFALLPDSAGVNWRRVDLPYQNTSRNFVMLSGRRAHVLSPIDRHAADVNLNKDEFKAVCDHGVAFGMDTNRGTVWLQESGDNYGINGVTLLQGYRKADGTPAFPTELTQKPKLGW